MSRRPEWGVEGVGWPNRSASRFVTAAGLRWHVQEMGEGPLVLLLHGSGAATHSWRDVAPRLATHFRVLALDLPGHGFTDAPAGVALSLPEMARRVGGLLEALGAAPALTVGHSAGAAVAIRMALDGGLRSRAIVAFNGALTPFPGVTAPLFQGLARALFANPLAAHLIAMRAQDPARIAGLIERTGSHLDPEGLEFYRRLLKTPGHVASTLGMMASWDLEALRRDYGRLETPLTLVVGDKDAAVPPRTAEAVRASVPQAEIVTLPGLGHLAHEERPDLAVAVILDVARQRGVLPEEEAA